MTTFQATNDKNPAFKNHVYLLKHREAAKQNNGTVIDRHDAKIQYAE